MISYSRNCRAVPACHSGKDEFKVAQHRTKDTRSKRMTIRTLNGNFPRLVAMHDFPLLHAASALGVDGQPSNRHGQGHLLVAGDRGRNHEAASLDLRIQNGAAIAQPDADAPERKEAGGIRLEAALQVAATDPGLCVERQTQRRRDSLGNFRTRRTPRALRQLLLLL
jgi:hypothetical protein